MFFGAFHKIQSAPCIASQKGAILSKDGKTSVKTKKETEDMTNLECDVTTCAYNCSNLCRKQAICVDGRRASSKDQTCCGSFEPRDYALSNQVQFDEPEESTKITCKAKDCTFNAAGSCDARHISVCTCGCQDPCTCDETECASFQKNSNRRFWPGIFSFENARHFF